MVFLFNDIYCYPLSYCSDEEFNKLNIFKRISYKWCMKRVLRSLPYDKTTKFVCDKESIHTCLMLSKYINSPSIIDMDGLSYLNNSEYWEKFYGVSTE